MQQRCATLAAKVARHVSAAGVTPSVMEQVSLIYSNEHHGRVPVLYQPRIIVILQGHKIGYLADHVFHYGPDHYLMMTLPLPCECECFASPESPLIGFAIEIDLVTLQELLLELGDSMVPTSGQKNGVQSVPMSEQMLCAFERLIDLLDNPLHAKVLGRQTIREILFYALHEAGGPALQALANRHGNIGQIARVLRLIEQRYADNLTMEELAREVNMSISAFHHHFKAVTATSPLQYIKSLRLHKARMLMMHDGIKAGTAAAKVGYESNSQFSREYKRFFGSTPTDQASRFREGQLRIEQG